MGCTTRNGPMAVETMWLSSASTDALASATRTKATSNTPTSRYYCALGISSELITKIFSFYFFAQNFSNKIFTSAGVSADAAISAAWVWTATECKCRTLPLAESNHSGGGNWALNELRVVRFLDGLLLRKSRLKSDVFSVGFKKNWKKWEEEFHNWK